MRRGAPASPARRARIVEPRSPRLERPLAAPIRGVAVCLPPLQPRNAGADGDVAPRLDEALRAAVPQRGARGADAAHALGPLRARARGAARPRREAARSAHAAAAALRAARCDDERGPSREGHPLVAGARDVAHCARRRGERGAPPRVGTQHAERASLPRRHDERRGGAPSALGRRCSCEAAQRPSLRPRSAVRDSGGVRLAALRVQRGGGGAPLSDRRVPLRWRQKRAQRPPQRRAVCPLDEALRGAVSQREARTRRPQREAPLVATTSADYRARATRSSQARAMVRSTRR